MKREDRTLLLGWGNPGRLDDGLGPACVEKLRELGTSGVVLDSDYQLTMEDAAEVAGHPRVVFVDAARTGPEPFFCRRLRPSRDGSSFSTHSVTPAAVLSLARDLFEAEPEAWIVGIRGYAFDEFGETLTDGARANLAAAVGFLHENLERGAMGPAEPPRVPESDDELREVQRCQTKGA